MMRESCTTPTNDARHSGNGLRQRYSKCVDAMLVLSAEIDSRLQILESKELRWTEIMAEVESKVDAVKSRIDLNVGGHNFATTKSTLLRWEGTYFHAMLGNGTWMPCDDGCYFIDRNPQLFKRIIEAFRTGEAVDADGLSDKQVLRLGEECGYFQLPHVALSGLTGPHVPRWDPARCSHDLTISEAGRVVTKTTGGGWKGVLSTVPGVDKFKVRILNTRGNVMVGYAKAGSFSTDQANHDISGWFIQCGLGSLWSAFGDRGRAYAEPLKQGDVLEVRLNTESCCLAFAVNDQILGEAFSSVNDDEGQLFPCVELLHPGDALVLED